MSFRQAWGAIGAVAIAGVAMLGCPKGTCLFEVCHNGQCACHISTCVEGAEFNTKTRRCACVPGRYSLAGQCMLQAQADAFCGKGFRYGQQGCEKLVCRPGDVLDQETNRCLPAAAVGGAIGVQVGQGQTLSCAAGSVLVIEGGAGACVPQEQTCAPDESWDGARCAKVASCPTGSQWDAAVNNCVAYSQTGDDAVMVNTQQWAESSYGRNGGTGTTNFCNRFVGKPWRFGVSEGQSATLQIVVQLTFPGGKVAQGQAATQPSYVGNPIAVPPRGQEAVATAANDILQSLRNGGGRAQQQQAITTVTCTVRNAAPPIPVSTQGGF